VNFADESRKSVFPEAECRYRVWSGYFKNPTVDTISRCVIGPKKLRDGLFAKLIENLRAPAQQPSRASDVFQCLSAGRAFMHVTGECLPPHQRQAPIDEVVE
jgi:hypothetical protein